MAIILSGLILAIKLWLADKTLFVLGSLDLHHPCMSAFGTYFHHCVFNIGEMLCEVQIFFLLKLLTVQGSK